MEAFQDSRILGNCIEYMESHSIAYKTGSKIHGSSLSDRILDTLLMSPMLKKLIMNLSSCAIISHFYPNIAFTIGMSPLLIASGDLQVVQLCVNNPILLVNIVSELQLDITAIHTP